MLPANWDWHHPDYRLVFEQRLKRLQKIRENPECLPALRRYYRDNPADFINDWGITFDPRNLDLDQPAIIPFLLFQRQRDWIDYALRKWKERQPALTEKSRDGGLTWLAISFSCTLCLFHHGMSIGFGSRKEIYVDNGDDPKSIFWKGRLFMKYLPREFRGGWDFYRDAPHMRINFPATEATIGGEAGDNIGRGDRRAIYFVDEAAHLERPDLVDFSLSQTTNCRHDISSVNGRSNSFAEKRFSGRVEPFTFHWRDDPRKDDEWYKKECAKWPAVVVAQEIDIDYAASAQGILIPSAWVQAAVNAHEKLGIKIEGERFAALDVADEGEDKNSLCGAHGILVEECFEWSGKGRDIFATVETAFDFCDANGYDSLRYDADGLGAGVRGDGRVINERRKHAGQKIIDLETFRGSAGVIDPEAEELPGRKNQDYYLNAKAQAWFGLARRFELTWQAVTKGVSVPHDRLISLSPGIRDLNRLIIELSQPTYDKNGVGKMFVEKTPDGTKSPNLADAVMIRFARLDRKQVGISKPDLEWLRKVRR